LKRSAIAAAALAATISVQAVAAPACLTEREMANMAVYAVPALVTGVRTKCAARLAPSGFLAAKGDAFAARYAALQGETWPVAKAGLLKFAGAKTDGTTAMLAQLPDNSVRPLVDGLISQKIAETVRADDCANVERGIQLASLMSPRDSGAMVAFVLLMAKPKALPICPAPAPSGGAK
jgi:hypothetical protein